MLFCRDNSTGPREKRLTFIAGLSHLHVFLTPFLEPFSVCFSSYALRTLFLCSRFLPSCTGSVVGPGADQLSIMFSPPLTKPTPPPRYPWSPPTSLSLPDKAGFGNNFTTGDNKSVAQNMEAVVVGCMFKSLITRCASTTHELHSPENLVSGA